MGAIGQIGGLTVAPTNVRVDGMDTPRRFVRVGDAEWKQLTKLAQTLVLAAEMPNGARPTDARVSILLQKIARGEIVCSRVEDS